MARSCSGYGGPHGWTSSHHTGRQKSLRYGRLSGRFEGRKGDASRRPEHYEAPLGDRRPDRPRMRYAMTTKAKMPSKLRLEIVKLAN